MTIYASYPSARDSWSVIGCAPSDFQANTAYREIVIPTAASTERSIATSMATETLPMETAPQVSTSMPPTETPQAPAATSQAWIAAAVIVPVVAIIAVGYLAFWLGRRRGRREGALSAQSPSTPVSVPSKYPFSQGSSVLHNASNKGISTAIREPTAPPAELDSSPPAVELGATRQM